MFLRTTQMQYPVRVEAPDPLFARHVQELLGGKYGELTVMLQYLQQGWSMRGTESNRSLARIRDMLLDTATEEMAHVEMLSSMIAQLLDGASPSQQAEAASASDGVAAALGGSNPQHLIVSGLGPQLADSNGNPWNGTYPTASGNVVVDLYADANYEQNGRLQAARVHAMTRDASIRDTLSFMLARDQMHQVQFLAAIEELGGEKAVLPAPDVPAENVQQEHGYAFMSYAATPDQSLAGEGRWASGEAPGGKGRFSFVAEPFALGKESPLPPAPADVFDHLAGGATGEPKKPRQSQPGIVEKMKDAIE